MIMEGRFKLHWASYIGGDGIGNAYGYRTHHQTLKRYVEKIADLTDEARDSFMITSPDFYTHRIKDKINWLFTMFEGTTIPDPYLKSISKADYLVAPSTWVKNLFDKYFSKEKSFVVHHGVENHFRYVKRKYPLNKPFQYLWVGAPNPRKGWEEIIAVWKGAKFDKDPHSRLYLKTTRLGKLEQKGNVIFDARDLSREELVQLYKESHCFLFPTRGEGFGLTLAEAMRTGLPCISTYYSGVTDFFNEDLGYPIGYKMGEGKLTFIKENKEYPTQIAYPVIEELAEQMFEVRVNYEKALFKGWQASRFIQDNFTWERAAKTLVDTIRRTHG